MQPTNMYNNQNGMGPSMGLPRGQYQQEEYYPGQHQVMDSYSYRGTPAPWDSGKWRDISQPPMSQHIPFRGMSIHDPADIKPMDIPMDGHMSFFPMDDYSCIYAKVWSNDGVLRTFRFFPETIEQVEAPVQAQLSTEELVNQFTSMVDESMERFGSRLDILQDQLNGFRTAITALSIPPTIESSPTSSKAKSTTKKEAAE